MKKLIAILSLAIFACAAYAGAGDCCPGKAKDKQECPAKKGKCPAGADHQKQADNKS